MMQEMYEQLFSRFEAALNGAATENLRPVQVLALYLSLIREHVHLLREKVMQLSFGSVAEEIWFFKYLKPKFYAEKIFRLEVYNLEMSLPAGTSEMIRAYLEAELLSVRRFFNQYAFGYQYFRSGATELDERYFLRGADVSIALVPELPEPDPLFTTAMDYLFAKFIAFERLREEILRRIRLLDSAMVPADVPLPDLGIKWTGKIVNLGELVYGLYYTGQLNNGNAQLSEIVALFERMFKVKIRDVHHTFGEIRERKVSSPSRFIDSMAASIQQRVDEDLNYKPGKR